MAATERSESWCWFALRAERPADAAAAAAVHRPNGDCLGVLAAWEPGAHPTEAMKIDARAIDPNGEEASVSLVLAPERTWLPFDDPAVSHAIRAVLLGRPADVLSTLLRDDFRFVGAITGVRGREGRLADDPFGRVFCEPAVHVEAGLLGRTLPVAGPTMQRHGSANPWPAGVFGS